MTRNSNPPGRFAPPYIWVGSPAVWAYQPQLPQSSPQVMPDSFILDLEPTKFTLVPDLGSVVKLDTQNPAAVLFLQAATLPKGRCLAAGIPGFKFVTDDDTRGRQRATGGRARCARRGGDERADTGFSADRAASTGVAGNHRCAATCRCSCCSPGSSKVDYAAAADAGLRLPVRAWAVAAADEEGLGCHGK